MVASEGRLVRYVPQALRSRRESPVSPTPVHDIPGIDTLEPWFDNGWVVSYAQFEDGLMKIPLQRDQHAPSATWRPLWQLFQAEKQAGWFGWPGQTNDAVEIIFSTRNSTTIHTPIYAVPLRFSRCDGWWSYVGCGWCVSAAGYPCTRMVDEKSTWGLWSGESLAGSLELTFRPNYLYNYHYLSKNILD